MTHLYTPETAPDVPDSVRPKIIGLADYMETVQGVRPLWSLRDGQLVGATAVSIRDDDGVYHIPLELTR